MKNDGDRQAQRDGIRAIQAGDAVQNDLSHRPRLLDQPFTCPLAKVLRTEPKADGCLDIKRPFQKRRQVGSLGGEAHRLTQQQRPDGVGIQESSSRGGIALGRNLLQQ